MCTAFLGECGVAGACSSRPSPSRHQPLCYFRFLCDRAATATSPHTLVAFLATEHCVKLEALSDEELVSRAMAKLAAAFPEQCTSATSAGVGAASSAGGGAGASTSTSTGESKPAATVNAHGLPQPVGWLVTRWRSDPFARGAWTCYTVGCRGPSDALELAKPVDGCLFFAGEATEPRAQVTHHCLSPAQPQTKYSGNSYTTTKQPKRNREQHMGHTCLDSVQQRKCWQH